MYAMRGWSVRHARALARVYARFEGVLRRLHPLFERIGYERLERPVAAVEKRVKGFMFDCSMCGACTLRFTGMSCPMNCPKRMRNGPCGGVRADGGCEVYPQMRCVWLEAREGARRMGSAVDPSAIAAPLDHRLRGRSTWLQAARGEASRAGRERRREYVCT